MLLLCCTRSSLAVFSLALSLVFDPICPLALQINEEIPVKHLPGSEPDPHVVRIGWSLNHCSTQLGERSQTIKRMFNMKET